MAYNHFGKTSWNIADFSKTYHISNNRIRISEIPNKKEPRRHILSFTQVKRLNYLMKETLPIHGKGNVPTIYVKLCDLVSTVRLKLDDSVLYVREIRMYGSIASEVLSARFLDLHNNTLYTDIDIMFKINISDEKCYEKVKTEVIDSILEFSSAVVRRYNISSYHLRKGICIKNGKNQQR